MKKSIKIIILTMLFCFSICLFSCQAPTQQTNENMKNINCTTSETSEINQLIIDEADCSDWKTAYLNFIIQRESEYERGFRYALAYIDNDDIPELYIVGICEADGDLVCSYKNGQIIEQNLSRKCGGKYVEKSGLLINQNGHQGRYYDDIYKLDENGFSQILHGTDTEHYTHLGNDDYEILHEYLINDCPVTKDEYEATINACIDLSQTAKLCCEISVSYEVIIQQIQNFK